MTNKPRYFWVYEGKRNCTSLRFVYTNPQTIKQDAPENWNEFYVIEAGPVLEKIKRLGAALQKCKEQRDSKSFSPYQVISDNLELESILEGK